VQHKDGWYGLTLTIKDKEISDVKVFTDCTLEELKLRFAKDPLGVHPAISSISPFPSVDTGG